MCPWIADCSDLCVRVGERHRGWLSQRGDDCWKAFHGLCLQFWWKKKPIPMCVCVCQYKHMSVQKNAGANDRVTRCRHDRLPYRMILTAVLQSFSVAITHTHTYAHTRLSLCVCVCVSECIVSYLAPHVGHKDIIIGSLHSPMAYK